MRVANWAMGSSGFAMRGLCRLLLRTRRTPRTAPTPATAANGLRLRDERRRHCLLGNGPWRTTRTTRAPFPSALPAPTVPRLRLGAGDASEQRLDRGADLLLNHVPDHRYEASLSRHRSLLCGAWYTRTPLTET